MTDKERVVADRLAAIELIVVKVLATSLHPTNGEFDFEEARGDLIDIRQTAHEARRVLGDVPTE